MLPLRDPFYGINIPLFNYYLFNTTLDILSVSLHLYHFSVADWLLIHEELFPALNTTFICLYCERTCESY